MSHEVHRARHPGALDDQVCIFGVQVVAPSQTSASRGLAAGGARRHRGPGGAGAAGEEQPPSGEEDSGKPPQEGGFPKLPPGDDVGDSLVPEVEDGVVGDPGDRHQGGDPCHAKRRSPGKQEPQLSPGFVLAGSPALQPQGSEDAAQQPQPVGEAHQEARDAQLRGQRQEGAVGLAFNHPLLLGDADLPEPHVPDLQLVQLQIEVLPEGHEGGDAGADPSQESQQHPPELRLWPPAPGHAGAAPVTSGPGAAAPSGGRGH